MVESWDLYKLNDEVEFRMAAEPWGVVDKAGKSVVIYHRMSRKIVLGPCRLALSYRNSGSLLKVNTSLRPEAPQEASPIYR
jgi:hypothetical protein